MDDYTWYEVVVIGAGHAGIEACLAAARVGAKTAVFTVNMASVGNCPCSPSIGGIAKGTLVREIDALGGEMGKLTDKCFIHSKILGSSKGPAVQSIRAQIDRDEYKIVSKYTLESNENIHLRQAEIIEISQNLDNIKGYIWNLRTRSNIIYKSKTVILASGTYLNSIIYIGECSYSCGPDGLFCASFLRNSFEKLGISTKRFKTGTPARILKSSIDFSCLEVQHGDEKIIPFSYNTVDTLQNKAVCHIAWTNLKTKQIILNNIKKSPMFNGQISGIGPRYCPSIENKMCLFPTKERHQIFVEPCGLQTNEVYLHGTSSCLPEDVQIKFYRTIPGFETAILMRPAYAIEYDIIDPVQLNRTLEFKKIKGLFSAGQVNGSSGYEEAAAQGIIAGINAGLTALNKDPIILDRASSYIGTLIDDITTKGVYDPYRMLTSRSEYRLLIRLDNADERLMPIGRKIGLVNSKTWQDFQVRILKKENEIKKIKKIIVKPSEKINKILENLGTKPICNNITLEDLLKRPEINYKQIEIIQKEVFKINNILGYIPEEEVLQRVEIFVKYRGYIQKQLKQLEKNKKLENKKIPVNIDYNLISNLRCEAKEKFSKLRPENLSQALSISGINSVDISILTIWLKACQNF
ncbi:MAG: tRNA uridine-5-carboxymethylaminomethyl(34) synthesis enzyme MnmG [Candidatus Improbicoccus devescovinae]|nr:MAG: tRNA uridine-5-carboxymethylaminomethyl(34) synthesis enzyme MnmG [Candidatus Improbicoccus devescovinae]